MSSHTTIMEKLYELIAEFGVPDEKDYVLAVMNAPASLPEKEHWNYMRKAFREISKKIEWEHFSHEISYTVNLLKRENRGRNIYNHLSHWEILRHFPIWKTVDARVIEKNIFVSDIQRYMFFRLDSSLDKRSGDVLQ